MSLCLVFFSFVEKILLWDGLECNLVSFKFNCSISDMDYEAMVDDKTEDCVHFRIWCDMKQHSPKKPPWIRHDLDSKERRLMPPDELFNILFFILAESYWSVYRSMGCGISLLKKNIYFDTIYLVWKHIVEIMNYIKEKVAIQCKMFNLFVVWRYTYNHWKFVFPIFISYGWINILDSIFKNLYIYISLE